MLALTFHLSDGSTVAITKPQPAAYLDVLRADLNRRLSGEAPDPVKNAADEWVIPAGDHVFRVGTDDAGSLIPVGHIVRVTWSAWCSCMDDDDYAPGPWPAAHREHEGAPWICDECKMPRRPEA